MRWGKLEIRNDSDRELAKEALSKLWDAMDLSSGGGGISFPDKPDRETHRHYYTIYRYVGQMLLGEECPEKEQFT